MRTAINTEEWEIATKDSITTEEGLKQLKQAVDIGLQIVLDIREYLDKKGPHEENEIAEKRKQREGG